MHSKLLRNFSLFLWLLLAAGGAQAQNGLKFKLQLMPDGERWGVFVKPEGVNPTTNLTITTDGQVTLVMPLNYEWDSFESVNGNWNHYAPIDGVPELPNNRIQIFYLVSEDLPIVYNSGEETLLFTFKGIDICPDSLFLWEEIQLFNCPADCWHTWATPLNQLTVFDIVTGDIYLFGGNYALSAWDCHDNDGDGFLNAHEDSNGNGVYDIDDDVSDLNTVDYHPNALGMKFKLQLMPDGQRWGVYVQPEPGLEPSSNTLTGSAQVTVVMPKDFEWTDFVAVAGTWGAPSIVIGPMENPGRKYVSFGFQSENPAIQYQAGQATLLFTFKTTDECPESLHLIEANDPFFPPNSIGSNPGNEITVFDIGNGFTVYQHQGNYAHSAWNCHDNDGDGFLNALEDTNGNGVYDVGVDVSDLNVGVCDLAITSHPASVTECAGNSRSFCIQTSYNGQFPLNYQWQVCTSGDPINGPWLNLQSNSIYTGATTACLNIANVIGLDGYHFRASVQLSTCPPVTSNAALLEVVGNASFSIDPNDAWVCSGGDTTFFATASIPHGTFSFGWQYSDDNGATWINISFPNSVFAHSLTGAVASGTDVLTISNVAGMYNRRFRAVASATDCGSIYSNEARLRVEGPLSVTDQPDPVVECSGNNTTFSATIANDGGLSSTIYRWQVSTDGGGTWNNLSNNSIYNGTNTGNPTTGTSILSISNVAGFHGYCYRLSYRSGTCDVQYTNSACLTVEGPITITDHPDDVTQCVGESVTFTGAANIVAGNVGTLIYNWVWSSDCVNYSNVIAGGTNGFAGVNTPTLTVGNVAGINGRCFRLDVRTAECNNAYSHPARLTVEGPLTIVEQPQDFTNCADKEAAFYVGFSNSGQGEIFKQWQYSSNGGISWNDIVQFTDTLSSGQIVNFGGYDSDTLLVVPLDGLNGYLFRNIFWTASCNRDTSSVALLTIEGPLTIIQQPEDVFPSVGSTACFSITAENATSAGSIEYQWQVWTTTGWYDITNNTTFTGTNTQQLCVSDVDSSLNGLFRCKIRTANCDWEFSDHAILAVGGFVTFTSQPENLTICTELQACFTVSAQPINSNSNNLQYQWQRQISGVWTDLSNSATYAGTDESQLCINELTGLNGSRFRCAVRLDTNSWSFSNQAFLYTAGPTIMTQPLDRTICSNRHTLFHTEVANNGAGQTTFRWQYSKDGGSTWSNFTTDIGALASLGVDNPTNPNAQWQGAFGKDLSLNNVNGLDGWKFRAIVKKSNCEKTTNEATLTVLDACQDESCDYDSDGILNELDGDYNNCGTTCIKASLQLLPDSSGWAVMARPFGEFDPSLNTKTSGGRFTIVAPSDFVFSDFESEGGNWLPIDVQTNLQGHPDKKFITVELMNTEPAQIPYTIGQATPLFRFAKIGECPEFLYIAEASIPGILPNMLSGTDNNFAGGFELCGVFARKAWRCERPDTGIPPIITPPTEPSDSLTAPMPHATDRAADFPDGKAIAEGNQWFTASPNPAGEFVNILVAQQLAEGQQTLSLWDLQGKKRLELSVENAATQLDLSGLPAGVYLVSLAQNGRVLQRTKLIKY